MPLDNYITHHAHQIVLFLTSCTSDSGMHRLYHVCRIFGTSLQVGIVLVDQLQSLPRPLCSQLLLNPIATSFRRSVDHFRDTSCDPKHETQKHIPHREEEQQRPVRARPRTSSSSRGRPGPRQEPKREQQQSRVGGCRRACERARGRAFRNCTIR